MVNLDMKFLIILGKSFWLERVCIAIFDFLFEIKFLYGLFCFFEI